MGSVELVRGSLRKETRRYLKANVKFQEEEVVVQGAERGMG
jgi:hypothetical protein